MSIAQDGNVLQRDGRTQSGPGGLGKRLLGGKALGQKPCRIAAGEISRMFGRGKNTVSVMFAKAGQAAANTPGIQQVGANAVNQGDTFTGKPAARIFSA